MLVRIEVFDRHQLPIEAAAIGGTQDATVVMGIVANGPYMWLAVSEFVLNRLGGVAIQGDVNRQFAQGVRPPCVRSVELHKANPNGGHLQPHL